MKMNRWYCVCLFLGTILAGVSAEKLASSFVASRLSSLAFRQRTIRGGNQKPSRWLAGPLGIRKQSGKDDNTQILPTVEDLEDTKTKEMIDAFLTRDSRNTFIARVYSILSVQMLFTTLVVLCFGLNPGLGAWMRTSGAAVPVLSMVLSSIAWFMISGSERARRQSPIKWQLLTLFTVGEALAVGFISSVFPLSTVMLALGATGVATAGVAGYTILNRNPKYDLSQWGAGLSGCAMVFLMYSLIYALELWGILPSGFIPFKEGIFSFFGVCLFTMFMAFDTKLIVGGKHSKYQMNEKDYVFGAMTLYLDVINIFIYLLKLIGDDND